MQYCEADVVPNKVICLLRLREERHLTDLHQGRVGSFCTVVSKFLGGTLLCVEGAGE